MTHQNLRLGKCWELFWATLNKVKKNSQPSKVYFMLYNNQINACTQIGQSAMV